MGNYWYVQIAGSSGELLLWPHNFCELVWIASCARFEKRFCIVTIILRNATVCKPNDENNKNITDSCGIMTNDDIFCGKMKLYNENNKIYTKTIHKKFTEGKKRAKLTQHQNIGKSDQEKNNKYRSNNTVACI